MGKYTQRLLEVQAVQFLPDVAPWPPGVTEIRPYWGSRYRGNRVRRFQLMGSGVRRIMPGDWVVTEPNGESRVVSNDTFREWYTYNEVKS